jgi:hypothetical protein
MGRLSAPGSVVLSDVSRLPALGQEYWHKIEFPPGAGVPKVEFALNEANAFNLHIFSACPATLLTCESGYASGKTYYRYEDGCPYCDSATAPYECSATPWPQTMLVRVMRIGGVQSTCSRFQLKVTR